MCNDLGVVLVGLLSICGLRVPNWLTSPNSTSRRVCQVILRIMVTQKGTIVKTQFKTEKGNTRLHLSYQIHAYFSMYLLAPKDRFPMGETIPLTVWHIFRI